ncbi:hypothetical protein [Lichenifustis flavocetrariae]|uniref:Uncharacterized protein n=1 Tax=Lichenifustis flavocetrariae TaxID=2949735 RepID=A0AA41Z2C8_9HYPH|nr:hypothetical protein [Lichenifustis flavocetrariae]MCW6512944.1 hypothetical protein [Lichenifustis flavocetrariae]
MTAVDLTVPATLKWTSRERACERHLLSLRDAVRVAMQELRNGEFLTAYIVTAKEAYQGDEIVELFQRGGIVVRRFALF